MKHIWSGLESSGKSYLMAKCAADIAWRNKNWYQLQKEYLEKNGKVKFISKFGVEKAIPRPIYSNLHFSKEFYTMVTKEYEIPIFYWENLDDLIKIQNADVFIDEVGNYFDSRMWTDLSLEARRWLTQGAKVGIELYGSAQDFAQVDKAFRRLVNYLTHVTKIIGSRRPSATKPPVKFIWGICFKRELNPLAYDEDKKEFATGLGGIIPIPFFLRRQYCELFDTTQIIKRSKPMPYKHVEKICENHPDCLFHKISHV